jgi:thiol-disulfide isomerase/thioredoxin
MPEKFIMFYGQDCPHCHAMMPLVDKLEKELSIKIPRKEVWNDDKNAEKMRKYAHEINHACGGELGVPSFVNLENKTALCGETNYDNLKLWATKK